MRSSTAFAEAMFNHCGAVVNIPEIASFTKRSEDWVRKQMSRVPPMDPSAKKKFWFYQDVAKALYGEYIFKI